MGIDKDLETCGVYQDGPLKGQPIIRLDHRVPWRADAEIMIDFFDSLYRHCSSGFLHYRSFPFFLDDPNRRLFFDISNGFQELPGIIEAHQQEGFKQGAFRHEYFFNQNLYAVPNHMEKDVETVAAVQVDVDMAFDQKILERMQPSIRVKTRTERYAWNRLDHFHFYWVLKKPIKPSLDYQKVMLRLFHFFFKGWWYECTGYQLDARIPGTLNHALERVTFVESDFEYEFEFFDDFLPKLSIWDAAHYAHAYREMLIDPKKGIV